MNCGHFDHFGVSIFRVSIGVICLMPMGRQEFLRSEKGGGRKRRKRETEGKRKKKEKKGYLWVFWLF